LPRPVALPRPGSAERAGPTAWGLFAFAIAFGVFMQLALWHDHGPVLDLTDVAAGVAACLSLLLRRSRPVPVALICLAAGAISPLAAGAALVACCSAAIRARGRGLAAVAVIAVASSITFPLVNPRTGEMVQVGFPAFLVTALTFGWGLYLRTRRELIASLRERADRLEADQQRGAELAREAERRRIAREMHDVLAHRLSLLSVHAGALEFRPDAPADDVARAAAVIRTSAADALNDLREVITVLREDTDAGTGPPQPGFGQLADLLAESRSAGMTVEAHIMLPDERSLPAATGRTAYRVVQEGLTNARKHAPGAPVEVTVTMNGDAGVVAEVTSRRAVAPAAQTAPEPGSLPGTALAHAVPGAGAGLIGLAERLELAGGQLEHHPIPGGGFMVRATIPAGT
jgi:signal transduction histidine kinase